MQLCTRNGQALDRCMYSSRPFPGNLCLCATHLCYYIANSLKTIPIASIFSTRDINSMWPNGATELGRHWWRLWLVAYMEQNHYLNQMLTINQLNHEETLHREMNENADIFFKKYTFKYFDHLARLQCGNTPDVTHSSIAALGTDPTGWGVKNTGPTQCFHHYQLFTGTKNKWVAITWLHQ